jgi:hypothetical protein
MSESPFMNAAHVASVHSGQKLEPSDSWPFMRTAYGELTTAQVDAPQRVVPQAPNVPFQYSQQTSMFSPMQGTGPQPQQSSVVVSPTSKAPSGLSKLSIPEDTAKLVLFAGTAVGAVLLLDVAARLFVNMATRKK